jgi:hypothetical protein
MNPGNPVQWYVRCFAEQRNFFFSKQGTAERARYLVAPLSELASNKLRGYGGGALTQADWAARLDTPDWDILQRIKSEGADLMLPELGSLKLLAMSLRVRFRCEIARRDFDAAIVTAKTMFGLARHLGEYPASVANRLGFSVADLALDTLEEMLQQPGCPNLYWALTDLPVPLVELRKGIQGDRALVDVELGQILGDTVMSETQLDDLVGRLSGRMGFARELMGQPPGGFRARLAPFVKDAARVRAAQARLAAAGGSRELIGKFLPTQVILLDEKRAYEVRRDEESKLLAFAPWQIDVLNHDEPGKPREKGLLADFLPQALGARYAQARLEQRVALLRHVEALRMHTAGSTGKLPDRLADVGVPLPADPFSGKPFGYQLDGQTARLFGAVAKGEEKTAEHRRYELTIRK